MEIIIFLLGVIVLALLFPVFMRKAVGGTLALFAFTLVCYLIWAGGFKIGLFSTPPPR